MKALLVCCAGLVLSQWNAWGADEAVLRIPRSFVEEKKLVAELRKEGDDPTSAPLASSLTQWADLGPIGPPPDPSLGRPIAEFRDHRGCLKFLDWTGAQLCFLLMGDVSNLGLNDREMQLTPGSDPLLVSSGPGVVTGVARCPETSDGRSIYTLQQATRTSANDVSLHFHNRCRGNDYVLTLKELRLPS